MKKINSCNSCGCNNPSLYYHSNFTLYLENLRGSSWRFEIPTELYLKYKAKPRDKVNGNYEHYWNFVQTEYVDKILELLCRSEIGSRWKKEPLESTKLIVDFVHCFPYQVREPCYAKYPIETLCEHGGNCLDLSVLGISMFNSAGIDSCFLDFEEKEHVSVGVAVPAKGESVQVNGVKYYALELTTGDWPDYKRADKIGEFDRNLLDKANIVLMPRKK